jgi:hypothetical protein
LGGRFSEEGAISMERTSRRQMIGRAQPDVTRGMRSAYVDRPTEVEIRVRQRAYEIFASRGRKAGHDFDDWLQAEDEILWD